VSRRPARSFVVAVGAAWPAGHQHAGELRALVTRL